MDRSRTVKPVIGFSTGCFYTTQTVRETCSFLKQKGIGAIEINGGGAFERMEGITADDLSGFSYVSLHAPARHGAPYAKNKETEEVFTFIGTLNAMRPLDLVVFHPDVVEDFSVFRDLPFPFAFENMDKNKKTFRFAADMEILFAKHPDFSMVLDVNHIFTNDPSMRLADDYYRIAAGRIKEYHLSGYSELHDPLFIYDQSQIVRAVKEPAPIIIESLLHPQQVDDELAFIQKYLQ